MIIVSVMVVSARTSSTRTSMPFKSSMAATASLLSESVGDRVFILCEGDDVLGCERVEDGVGHEPAHGLTGLEPAADARRRNVERGKVELDPAARVRFAQRRRVARLAAGKRFEHFGR